VVVESPVPPVVTSPPDVVTDPELVTEPPLVMFLGSPDPLSLAEEPHAQTRTASGAQVPK
jgi:hypothetical protein